MRKKEIFFCLLMLFLLPTYYAQGVLYPSGGMVGQIILLLFFLISLFYFFKVLFFTKERLPLFIKIWTGLLLLNIIGFFLKGKFDNENISILRSILLNLLPFYAFYYFAQKGILKRQHLIAVLTVLTPLCIVLFIQSNLQLQDLRNREDVVDNTIYLFLGLIPFVFLFKRKVYAIIALLIFWIFIVQSAKRAAVVCGAAGILLFFYYQLKTLNKQYLIRSYFIGIGLIFGISYWGYNYFTENEFLLTRIMQMSEGDTSGRDQLSKAVFFSWYESNNLMVYLFGRGFNTSSEVTTHVSHNDWLEMLAGFGILGFFIYFSIFSIAFKEFLHKNWSFDKKIIFICIIMIGVVTSLTSRWYWSSFAYSQCLLLPYILATRNNEK